MEDRLDVVAVRIEHERAVVRRAVLRPLTRLAVALVTRLGHADPPRVYFSSIGGAERHMQVARERMLLVHRHDAEVAPLHQLAVERRQPERLTVERPACRRVGHMDLDVVEHLTIMTDP